MTTAAAMRAARVLAGLGIYWRRRLMEPEDKEMEDALAGLDMLRDQAMGALKAAGVAVNGLIDVSTLALANGDKEAATLAVQRARDAIAMLQEATGGG